METFRPITNRIVVKRLYEAQTESGILIPDIAQKRLVRAEVVAVGRGIYNKKTDKIETLTIEKGDIIYYNSEWAGVDIKVNGKDFIVFREDNIDGIEAAD